MQPTLFWKNFRLGEELSVSGAFIYNGLRRFHEIRKLDFTDEIFEVFYYFSIGFERLMKIAIVLLEHDETVEQKAFEESLITHSHQELLRRLKRHVPIDLSPRDHDFLTILTKFYKTLRYDRFSLQSVGMNEKEKSELLGFLAKHLHDQFEDQDPIFGTPNNQRYRKFVHNIVLKLSRKFFNIIYERSIALNIYTYEIRSGSKAATIFYGKADISDEDVLWKELLIFFMNTQETSGYLGFLRAVEPLSFDPALIEEYLACFKSDSAKSFAMDELEGLYADLADKGERLKIMDLVGASLCFDEDHLGPSEEADSMQEEESFSRNHTDGDFPGHETK